MKTLLFTLVGFLLATFTYAQDLSQLPPCAATCALSAIGGSGCPATNVTCICSSPTFITSYSGCVAGACNATEQQIATNFGIQYCAAAGVTIGASSAAPPPASSSAPATSAAAPATTAPPPTSTAVASSAPATSTAAPAVASSTSAAATTTAGGASSASASTAVATFSGNAAKMPYPWIIGLGEAVALAALL